MATNRKKTIKEMEAEWDRAHENEGKKARNTGKTIKEMEAEWDRGSTQRNAIFAANDYNTLSTNLPGHIKSYTDSRYQLGGSAVIKNSGVIPEFATYDKYVPIISRNLAAGKDYLGYSDEKFAEYQRQMLALAEEAQRGYNQATARTGGLDSVDMTGMPKAQQKELQALGNLSWRDDTYKSLSQPAAMGKQTPNIASTFDSPELYAQWVAAGGADETMQQLLKERETGTDYLDMYTAYDEGQIKKDLLNMQSYYSPQNPYRVTDEQYQDSRRRVYAALGTDYDEASRISGGKDNQWVMDALNAYRTGKNAVIEGAFGGDESKIDAYKKNVEATEEWLNYVAQKGKKLDTWQENAEKATREQLNAAGSDIDYYRPQPMYLNIDPTYLEGYREYQLEDGTYMPADEYRKNAINEWLMAYVDAGDNEAKISALDKTRGEYLPELEGYNLDALRYLDDEQKKALFTAHNNNDEEKVRELLDTYMYGLDFQRASDMETAWGQKYTEADTAEKIGMNVQSVGQNIGTALEGVKQAIWSIAAPEALEGISEYSPVYDKTRKANITRQMTGGEIAAKTEGVNIPWTDRNLWEAVYHGVMSGADSTTIGAMFAPLGPVAQAVAMGGISFANERMNKLQEGYSNSDANMDAWISAAIEGASEYLPFDIWGKNSPRAFVKALSGTAAETLGEMASELGSAVYDEGKYGHGRNELMAQGYGFDGENLWGKWLETKKDDILAAGIGGLVSGGGMSTVSAISDSVQNNKYGTNLSNNEGEQALADLAETLPVSKQAKDIVARMRAEMSERTKGDKVETEIADAATVTKRDANKAAKEKKHKAVKKAEIGYVYREVMRNLDEGAKNIVAQSFARDTIETELAQAGFRGDMRKAANDVVNFISGKTDSKGIERIKGNAAMREVALSYMAEIGNAQGELYSKAGELAQRASKDYVKPEATKAEKGAQEATQGIDDRAAISAEDIEVSDVPESMVDGKAVTIEGVASVADDGSVTYSVKDADGNVSEVSEADVEIGQNDETIATLSALAKDLGKNAETMIRMYAGSQNVEEYATEFRQAMQYGEDGRNLDVIKGYTELNGLNPDQITAAYEIGRGRRTLRNQKAVHRNAAGITVGKVDTNGINREILDDNQRAAIDFMSELAGIAGFNVRFVESSSNAQGKYADEAGEGFNQGEWNARTMTLTLDVHAGSNSLNDGQFAMMHTAGHELTHYIRQFADTDLWNDYQEFVIGHLSRKGFDFENEIEFHMEKEGLDRDGAIEEIIADASGEALNNITEADIQSLAETNPSLLSRIKAFFKQWISDLKARITEAYKGTEAKTEAGKQMKEAVDEMSKRWNALFINATRNRMRQNAKAIETVKAEPARSLGYRHIDQRTFDSVKEIDTELFMSDAEEAQIGMGAAAKILLSDLENSIPGQKIWIADGEVSGQKRQTSELLGRMKDELKLTYDQLRQNLQQFAALDNVVDGEIVLPKNTPNNRRIELYLHEMLTEGYTAPDGTKITPWDAYVEWVQGIDGAEGKKEYTAREGDVDFADYAWPGEVKYQARQNKYDYSKPFAEQVEDWLAGKIPQRDTLVVGGIPKVLQDIGFAKLPLVYDQKHMRNTLGNPKNPDHDLGVEFMKNLPTYIENPIAVFENAEHPEDGVIMMVAGRNINADGRRIVGYINVNEGGQINGISIDAVRLKTIHSEGTAVEKLKNAVENEEAGNVSLYYWDKKEALSYFGPGQAQRLGRSLKDGFNHSIAEEGSPVKTRVKSQIETAQFRRWFKGSKIVNEDGSPKVMYHGTPYGGFRVFKDWQYFTDNPEYAKTYQEPSASSIRGRYDPATNPQTYAVYLNVKKPFDTRDPKIKKIWQEEFYNQYSRTPLSDKGLPDWTDGIDLVEFIEENEYDYDAIILDEGALGGYGDEVKSRGISVVVRDSTQIKSATDNMGTFETGNRDIYMQARNLSQMSDREILADAMMTIAKTPAEQDILERYRKRIADLNKKQRDLEGYSERIRELREKGLTSGNSDELSTLLRKSREAKEFITKWDKQLLERESTSFMQTMLEHTKAQIAKENRAQGKKAAASRASKARSKAKIIAEVSRLQRWITHPSNKEHVPEFLAKPIGDILKEFDYSGGMTLKTREIFESGDEAAMLEWRKNVKARKDAAERRYKEALKEYEKTVDEGDEKKIDAAEKKVNRTKGAYESLADVYTRGIESASQAFSRADSKFVRALQDMSDAISRIGRAQRGLEENAVEFSGWLDLTEATEMQFGNLVKKIRDTLEKTSAMKDTAVNRMTAEQLDALAEAMAQIRKAVVEANQLTQNVMFGRANAAAYDTIQRAERLGERKAQNKTLAQVKDFINWKNVTPIYVFERFGKAGKAMFSELQDGHDQLARNITQLKAYSDKAYTPDEINKWSKELHEFKLSSGKTVQMTTAQVMSLYCLNRRDQARGHLLGGGIRVENIEHKGKLITQAEDYTLFEGDIEKITGSLTKRQKEVADALQKFMSTVCADWGNVVSMKRFGYQMFTEGLYFPIESDTNNLRGIDEQARANDMFRLLNLSATKALTEGANNAIVVRNIFDVFAAHSSDMAKYNALAIPILDTLKWYNYVSKSKIKDKDGKEKQIATASVRKSLEMAYGKEAVNYITTFIKDLNGVHDGGRDDGFVNKLTSNYKIASTGMNLRVMLLQMSSIPRAMYELSPIRLAGALAKSTVSIRKSAAAAKENVGIAQWKALGFYDTNIASNVRDMIKHDTNFVDWFKEISTKGAAAMDSFTMGVIYNAVQMEISAKHKGVKPGTAEYNYLLNKRVREVVYKTQVVDSTMTRSQTMRDKGRMSAFTNFMSEPTLALSMISESVNQMMLEKRIGKEFLEEERGDDKRTPKAKMARGFIAFSASALTAALLESLFDAFRDDDEYETFAEKYWSTFAGNVKSNFNPLEMIPILSDIASAIQGYENERMETSFIYNGVDALKKIYDYIKDPEGKEVYSVIYSSLQALSQMTGLAVSNLVRDAISIYNTWIAEPLNKPRIQTRKDSEKTVATAVYKAAMSGDTVKFEKLMGRAELYGITAEDLENEYNNLVSNDYLAGNINSDEAKRVFKMYGGKTEYQAQTLVDKLNYEKETGHKYSKVESEYVRGAISKADAKKALTTYGDTTAADADAKILTWDYEKATGRKYSAISNEYIRGTISRSEIKKAMVNYGGQSSGDAEKAILHLDYQKKTNRPWSKLMDDYIGGRFTRSQVKDYLMNYDLKDENEAMDTVDKYDWAKTHGGSTDGYSKYVTVHEAIDSGRGFDEAVEALVEKYTARGETRKEVLSSIRSSITSKYKPIYLAASETEQARMREELLDVYVALGGSYNTYYKNMTDKWFED